jgi:hypothetical protein
VPFAVPQGYFEALPAQIIANAKNNELTNNPYQPLPYAIPEGYFQSLPAQILAAAKNSDGEQKQKRRAIPLTGRSILRQLRWAAAAVLLVGIGIGSYKPLFVKKPYDTEKALAKVPQSDINDYVSQNIDDFDVDMLANNLASSNANTVQSQQLDNKEIIEYLNENGWKDTD